MAWQGVRFFLWRRQLFCRMDGSRFIGGRPPVLYGPTGTRGCHGFQDSRAVGSFIASMEALAAWYHVLVAWGEWANHGRGQVLPQVFSFSKSDD